MQQPSGNPVLALPVVSSSPSGRLGGSLQVTDSIGGQGFSSALSQAQPEALPYADAATSDAHSGNLLPPSGTALPVPADSQGVDLLAEVADAGAFADGELPAVLFPGQPIRYYPSAERSGVATLGPSGSATAVAASGSVPNSQGQSPVSDPPGLAGRGAGLTATVPMPVDVLPDSDTPARFAAGGPVIASRGGQIAAASAPGPAARLPRETADIATPARIDGAGSPERRAAIALSSMRAGTERDTAATARIARPSQDPVQPLPRQSSLAGSELTPELSPPLLRERATEAVNPWLRSSMASANARSTRSSGASAVSAARGNLRDAAFRAGTADTRMPPGMTLEAVAAETKRVSGDMPDAKPGPLTGALSGVSTTAGHARVATPPAAPTTVFAIEQPVLDPAWQTAVNERVVWMAGRNLQSAELRLNPAELGPVQVQVSVDDKVVSLSITAAHPLTRDALENAMPRLRDMLSEHGMDLSGATVDDQGRGMPQGDGSAEQAETLADEQFSGSDQSESAMSGAASPSPARPSDGAVDLFA